MPRRATTKISTTGKPWARYLRLSKAESAEIKDLTKAGRLELTNRKLDGHLERITRWMDAQGLPYDDDLIFRDPGLSAYKPNVRRPGWDALMEHAHAGDVAGIAGIAVDRFTRIVSVGEDLIALAEHVDVKVGGGRAGILDLTTYEGITMFRGMVQQAAHESLSTSFRLREKLEDQMRAGKPMGGGRSYGFEVVDDKYQIEVPQVPEEVAVIREMAGRMLAGEPLQHLAAVMNERGLVTSRGGRWTGANLGRMLGLPRYGGEVHHHGEKIATMPGDPILDRDTYEAVQAMLASRRRGARPTAPYLLTGILVCSACTKTMNGGSTAPRKDGSRPRVYRCPPQSGGCGRTILAEPVEEKVTERVIGDMAHPENAERLAKQQAEMSLAREELRAKLKVVEKQQANLVAKWAAGEMKDEAYERALPLINARLAKADAALREFDTTGDSKPKPRGGKRKPATDPGRIVAATEQWGRCNTDERRELIRQYRVRPIVDAKRPGTRRVDLDRVRIPD